MVLDYLSKADIFGDDVISLKNATLKFSFLLALASGKRRGEIHALENSVLKVNGEWNEVLLWPNPTFKAKTHTKTKGEGTFTQIRLRALPEEVLKEGKVSLCPVKMLRTYRDMANTFRSQNQKNLIISYKPHMNRDISKQTLSNYIKAVIVAAYNYSGENIAFRDNFKVTAHQVRQVSNSLKAIHTGCLDDVLRVACWRNASTFISFYLKDFSQEELFNLYTLGPFVALESVISG